MIICPQPPLNQTVTLANCLTLVFFIVQVLSGFIEKKIINVVPDILVRFIASNINVYFFVLYVFVFSHLVDFLKVSLF